MKSQQPLVHERYEQLALLGRGGAGEVYLVRDRTTGERIALKRLIRVDTQSLLHLKHEFRSLADLHHPNLVKLYELGHDATSPFFTMEYLEGQDLKAYLDLHWAMPANDNMDEDARHVARVLDVFLQLSSAVSALHRAHVLHRDLKPSNVMVVDGRVVVLDFGIAIQLGTEAITQDKLGTGSPAYMAPEQIDSKLIGKPNDWYSFGVMLYEALSGVLPIEGSLVDILKRKSTEDPAPISGLVPKLPNDVAVLCMGLLRRAPTERPNGEQVTRVLRAHAGSARGATPSLDDAIPEEYTTRGSAAEPSLFGREAELAKLHTVFRRVQAGAFAAVHLAGESGSGKTSLVQHFTEEVERADRCELSPPLVLRSRCYERETLPFKALDGAVDALVNHLSRESEIVVGHSLPSDVAALTQLFPAFNRLPSTKLLGREATGPAPSQARVQAEAALSEVLRRVAAQRSLVLWIDDLQWGDMDSVGILKSWLDAASIPNLMLVLSYRSEEISTSPCLRALLDHGVADTERQATIGLRALGEDHVRALCEERLELAGIPENARREIIEGIVREAEGSPFLASQLVELAVTQPRLAGEQRGKLSLHQLVRSRSSDLSKEALRLLNVASVAGRPLPLKLAISVAGIETAGRAALHELWSLHLVRTRGTEDSRLLEVYHDRLREVVQSLLPPADRLELDQRLFKELQASGLGDSDWLHVLALSTGERTAALRYGLSAADRARDMLAFERAAELYERCLTLTEDPAADGGELWEKLALAYARAGHGYKAASVYLRAASAVGAERALRFERSAASHLVCTGHYAEGEALVRKVLARLGESTPTSVAGLVAALVWERLRAALRGLDFEPTQSAEVPFSLYFRGEFLGMLSMETAMYDALRSALLQARCLRMALSSGEPEIIARAFCAAATIESVSGSERGMRRADELLARAEAIAKATDSSLLRTNLATARAACAFLCGRYIQSIELAYEAEHLHRTSSVDSEYHHRFFIASMRVEAIYESGQYRRAESELQAYLREAAATENINSELSISLCHTCVDLVAGRIDQARERLIRQLNQLPEGFGVLHVMHMSSMFYMGCATGEYDWAIDATREHWRAFKRSVVRWSEAVSRFAFEARSRLLLCRSARDGNVHAVANEVSAHIRVLARCRRPSARAEALRLRARLAVLHDERKRAKPLFERSIAAFDAAGARDQSARDRYALGSLIGGEQGQAMQRDALATLSEEGLVAPLENLRAYIPELLVLTG